MEIDEEVILALASEIDSDDSRSLAELFSLLLSQEHAARHQSRPRLVKPLLPYRPTWIASIIVVFPRPF